MLSKAIAHPIAGYLNRKVAEPRSGCDLVKRAIKQLTLSQNTI